MSKTAVIIIACVFFFCAILPAVLGNDDDIGPGKNGFDVRNIFNCASQNDLAIGDFDSLNPGNEAVVATMGPSSLFEIYNGGSGWSAREIFTGTMGDTLRSVTAGDFDQSHPGDEIAFTRTYLNSNVTLLSGSGTSWSVQELWSTTNTLFRLDTGEIDSTHTGEEIVVSGYFKDVVMIYNTGSGWGNQVIYTGSSTINDVCVGELESAYAGNEVAVSENNNDCVILYNDAGSWKSKVAATMPNPTGRLAIGEFDSASPGNEIAMGSLNIVYEINNGGSGWTSADIWYANSTVKDVTVGDFYSGNPGDEIAVSHDALEIAMVTGSGTSWSNTTLYTHPTSISYKTVVAGEVDSVHSGIEILAVTNIGLMFEIGEGTLPPGPPIGENIGVQFAVPILASLLIGSYMIIKRKKRKTN